MVRITAIVVLVLLCAACTRTELAYRNADWLLAYYARRTVDIDVAQREAWEPVLVGTVRRHKEQELPLIIAYLDLATAVARQTEDSVDAARLVEGAVALLRRHARLAVDLAVPLLAGLDDDQVEHLRSYLRERQEEAAEQYLHPDLQRRKDARYERFVDRIEASIGELNADQRQLLGGALSRIPDLSASWLAYRARQAQALLGLLDAHAGATELREFLTQWWVEQSGRSTEYQRLWRRAKQDFVAFLDALGGTLSERQRATFEGRLAGLGNDLASFLSPTHAPADLRAVGASCASKSV